MKRILLTASLIATLAACGAPNAVQAPAEQPAQNEPPLSAYVLPDASIVFHLHTAELRRLELSKAFYDAARQLHAVDDGDDLCGLPWEGSDEVIVSGNLADNDFLLVARVSDPSATLACLGEREGSEHATLWGRAGVRMPEDEVAVADHRRVLMGAPRRVEAALARPPQRAGARDVVSRLEGNAESLCRIYVASPGDGGPRAVAFSLDADDDHMTATLGLDMPTTAEADELNDHLRSIVRIAEQGVADNASAADRKLLGRMLGGVSIARHVGGRVTVDLEAVGAGEQQAMAFEAFVGFARGVANGYAKRAHAGRARATATDLAQRLAAYAEGNRRGFYQLPTFPAAAPATPAEVPSGRPVAVTAASWAHPSWQALAFAPEGELHYSYAIELSRDKRTATVRAIGDLDGDGKPSRIELSVRITPRGEVQIDAEPVVIDEFE